MVTVRNTRDDVIAAAGRLFAERGYHGTSMRDLGRELGLLGSSLYAHVDSKQDLLVEVVEEGARLFRRSADMATADGGEPGEILGKLIAGHVDVVVRNREVVRTFLNEARMLDDAHRRRVIDARDAYERVFRDVIGRGVADGSFRPDADPRLCAIFILSVLNAIERWFRQDGPLDNGELTAELTGFALSGLKG